MSTLIEFYCKDNIRNIMATLAFDFDKVIFFIDSEYKDDISFKNAKKKILEKKHINIETYDVNSNNIEEIYSMINIIKSESDVVIDYSGGRDITIAKVAMNCSDIPSFYIDIFNQNCINITNAQKYADSFKVHKFMVKDLIELNGASVDNEESHNHITDNDETKIKDLRNIIKLIHSDPTKWNRLLAILPEAIKKYELGDESLRVRIPENFQAGTLYRIKDFESVLYDLAEIGIINNIDLNDKHIRFTFKSGFYKKCFEISGLFLEYDAYFQIKDSNFFDDIQMSTTIDWNGKEITLRTDPKSEIDGIAIKNMLPIFVSCKMSKFDLFDIYEVIMNAKKFGGKYGKGCIICEGTKIDKDSGIYGKLIELNVPLINQEDIINNRIGIRMQEIFNDTYKF